MSRLFIALIYSAFALVTGVNANLSAGEKAPHACCCSAASSSCCTTDAPMDCCVDDNEEAPVQPQLPASSLNLDLSFMRSPFTRHFQLAATYVNEPLSNTHFHPPLQRVRPYLAFGKLIFYA